MGEYLEPLTELARQYGMPVATALAILVLGWLAAKAASFLTAKFLKKTGLGNRLAELIARGRPAGEAMEKGVSTFVYWLIMLFVLVAVFQSLGLTIVTDPLNALLIRITEFIPRALAAGVLILIAWVVATVVRLIVGNLLTTLQVDLKLRESVGEETTKVSLAATIADSLYYLVFLLFLPQILDALEMEGLSPVKDMVGEILRFLPNLLGAVVVLFIFYLVARVIQRLTTNLLASLGFDKLPEWLGVGKAKEGAASASAVAGYIILTVLLFLGVIQACNTLGMEIVSTLANELLQGLFKIAVACVIFGVGLILSRLAYQAISAEGRAHSSVLAVVARVAILVFTGAMALHKTDLAPEIVNLAFGALIVGIALAGGLAFGLGGREEATRIIQSWRKRRSDELADL